MSTANAHRPANQALTAPAAIPADATAAQQAQAVAPTRVQNPNWPNVAPGEAFAYHTDGEVHIHLGNFRLHRDARATAEAHPDGFIGIFGPGHTASTRHWALRRVPAGPGTPAEIAAATHVIPNGYYPNGASRPLVPVQVLWKPAPGATNRIVPVRRLDTGEIVPIPFYAIEAKKA